MGAVVAPVQLERIAALVEQGRAEGGVVWQPAAAVPADGWFYPPTVVTNVSPSSTVAQTEIFGPVVAVMPFRTPAEAVALANNTPYGLAASVWTENINLALDVAPQIKAGVVWVNATNLFDAAAGFGGYRESGFGREGGREGMWEYVTSLTNARRGSRGGRGGRGAAAVPTAPDAAATSRVAGGLPGSTARPSSTSAASRRGPTRATRAVWSASTGARSVRSARGTARTSATPSRPPTRRPAGRGRRGTRAPRFSTTSPRTSRRVPESSRRAWTR
jgi:aldehyde dehydrogenase (NAD+)